LKKDERADNLKNDYLKMCVIESPIKCGKTKTHLFKKMPNVKLKTLLERIKNILRHFVTPRWYSHQDFLLNL